MTGKIFKRDKLEENNVQGNVKKKNAYLRIIYSISSEILFITVERVSESYIRLPFCQLFLRCLNDRYFPLFNAPEFISLHTFWKTNCLIKIIFQIPISSKLFIRIINHQYFFFFSSEDFRINWCDKCSAIFRKAWICLAFKPWSGFQLLKHCLCSPRKFYA